MTITSLLGLGMLYLVLVGILTLLATKRKIGRIRIFFVSLFLTPVAGLLAYMNSEPVYVLELTRYRCQKCSIDFTETMGECPYCRRDGVLSRLQTVVMRTI